MMNLFRTMQERLSSTSDFDDSPARMQSMARAFRYSAYVALALAIVWALRWTADACLAAPGSMFLIWCAAMAAAAFVFRRPGFHAMFFLGALVFFYYPAHLIFAGSPLFAGLFLALAVLFEWRSIKKRPSWIAAGYILVFLCLAFILSGEILNTIFTTDRMNNPHGMKGIRRISGAAVIPGTDKEIDLTGLPAFSMLLSTNGKRLYASYHSAGAKGVAAFTLSNGDEHLFRPTGRGGARLFHIHPGTGAIFAGSIDRGVLYELAYDDLRISNKYDLTPKPFPSAVVDVPANQVFVPDMRDQSLKIFNLDKTAKPWARIPSGGFGFKLFPDNRANLLPGTGSLSQLVQDPVRRRIFMTYAYNRNLVVVDMDTSRVSKIDRRPYAWTGAAAFAPGPGLLFLAKPLGFIEYYDTNTLRITKRLMRRGGYRALDFDPVENRLVAANYYSGVVHFINVNTGRDMARRSVCRRITHLSVSPVTGMVYINCEKGLYELDPQASGVLSAKTGNRNGM